MISEISPEALEKLRAEFPTNTWMFSDHYNCKECGGQVDFWKRLHWRVSVGVTSVGGCNNCGIVLLECEKLPPKWIKVTA